MFSSIKFMLKDKQLKLTPSKQKETPIYLLASYGYFILVDGKKKYQRLKYYTGHKVHPELFSEKHNRIKVPNGHVFDMDYYKAINKELDNIETLVKKILINNKHESPETIRELIREELNPQPKEDVTTLKKFMASYIKELEGKNKRGLKEGTIRALRSSVKIFGEFCDHMKKDYDFNDIDLAFHEDYVDYLYSERSYSDNAVGNQIKNIKSIMRRAKDEGLHNNLIYTHSDFDKPKSEAHSIALTQNELDKLANLDLSNNPEYDLIRDIFLCGCYTAQRISDYSRYNKSMIKGDNLVFKQIKTRTPVKIPISTPLRKILEKYDYKLPKVSEQALNINIKLIARIAKITDIEEWESECRKVIKTESAERCTLISSHTARRTGATLMYENKMSIAALKKITGHKSEQQLKTYLKINDDDLVEEASKNPFLK